MIKYILTVLKHKWFVFLACRKIGHIPLWRAIIHDWSKFTSSEYKPYRDKVLNNGETKNVREYGYAWLHHQNHNPHHWEYWKFFWQGDPHFYDGLIKNDCFPMPETYIWEMIADWMGSSKLYTQSWDITDWVPENLSKMQFHPETKDKVIKFLDSLGYWN